MMNDEWWYLYEEVNLKKNMTVSAFFKKAVWYQNRKLDIFYTVCQQGVRHQLYYCRNNNIRFLKLKLKKHCINLLSIFIISSLEILHF